MAEKQAFPPTDGVAEVGDTLVASPLSVVGPTRVRWKRNGVDIPGAVGRNYTPTVSDLTAEIRASLTFLDGRGNQETRESNPTFPVKNYAVDWPFAEYASQYPGQLPGPWKNLSRTGLGTRVDSAGLVQFGPHNLLARSWRLSSWSANGTPTYNGNGTPIAGFQTGAFSTTGFGHGYFQNIVATAGTTYTLAYYIRRTAGTAQLTIGTDSLSQTFATFNPANGTFSAGPAEKGAVDLGGGAWLAWVRYTPASSGNLAVLAYVWGGASTYELAAWATAGAALLPYIETDGAARYLPRLTHDPALDINGVPYTVTEQYGAERITNGAFATNTTGWSLVGAGGSMAAVSGELEITGSGGGYPGARQTLTGLTVGNTYRLTCSARRGTTAQNVTVFAGSASVTVTGTASTPVSMFFVAASTSVNIEILINAGAASGTAYVDNVSVQEYLGTVTNGTPRPLGLLVEGQGTNLAPRTESFDDAAWTKTNLVPTANAAVAPDGTTTADRLAENTTNGYHNVQFASGSVTSGTAYVASVYFKPAGRTRGAFRLRGEFSDRGFNFDLSGATPVIGTLWNGLPSSGARIEVCANGWYRLSCTTTASATALSGWYLGLSPGASPDASGGTYAGDGASGAFLWGAQFETGSIATSYIPNPGTGSAVRPADDWFLSGAAFTAAIDPSVGTFFVEFFWAPGPPVGGVFSISDNTNSNRIDYRAGQSYVEIAVGGVVLAGISAGMSPQSGWNRIAVAWSAAGYAISLNGGAPVTGTANCSGLAASQLQLGNINPRTNTTFHLGYPIRTARSFRGQYITGAALQALTA